MLNPCSGSSGDSASQLQPTCHPHAGILQNCKEKFIFNFHLLRKKKKQKTLRSWLIPAPDWYRLAFCCFCGFFLLFVCLVFSTCFRLFTQSIHFLLPCCFPLLASVHLFKYEPPHFPFLFPLTTVEHLFCTLKKSEIILYHGAESFHTAWAKNNYCLHNPFHYYLFFLGSSLTTILDALDKHSWAKKVGQQLYSKLSALPEKSRKQDSLHPCASSPVQQFQLLTLRKLIWPSDI